MPRLRRLVFRFIDHPNEIYVEDCIRLLEMLGYERKKQPGSHHVFHKRGAYPITIPTIKGRKVKKAYVELLVKTLRLGDIIESEG